MKKVYFLLSCFLLVQQASAYCGFHPEQDIFSDDIKNFISSYEETAELVNKVNQKTLDFLKKDDPKNTGFETSFILQDAETLYVSRVSLFKEAKIADEAYQIAIGDVLYLTLPNLYYKWRESDCSVIKAVIKANEKNDISLCHKEKNNKNSQLELFINKNSCSIRYKNNHRSNEHKLVLKMLNHVILPLSQDIYSFVQKPSYFTDSKNILFETVYAPVKKLIFNHYALAQEAFPPQTNLYTKWKDQDTPYNFYFDKSN